MISKTEKQFLFEVELNRIAKNNGVLSARDAEGCVYVSTAKVFGGKERSWSPEHLFLGSISSCFMNTFLSFAESEQLPVSTFACEIIGRIDFYDGRFRFSGIDLYPTITVPAKQFHQQAMDLLEKARQYATITGSMTAPVLYHYSILTEMETISNKS
jgi:organic hydroperoxide reductase OsmC/OhrA